MPLQCSSDSEKTAKRLQVSLVATSRSGSKVHHEHVAGLGSVPHSPIPADRIALWRKVEQRLATLANEIDDAQKTVVIAAIAARIPMVTTDELQAVQLERARDNERLWSELAAQGASELEMSHAQLAAALSRISG